MLGHLSSPELQPGIAHQVVHGRSPLGCAGPRAKCHGARALCLVMAAGWQATPRVSRTRLSEDRKFSSLGLPRELVIERNFLSSAGMELATLAAKPWLQVTAEPAGAAFQLSPGPRGPCTEGRLFPGLEQPRRDSLLPSCLEGLKAGLNYSSSESIESGLTS